MIRKTFQNLLLPIWTTSSFAIGILATLAFGNKLSESGWAETISAIATVIALTLAVITFRSWQHQRIREDAYSTTKTYITTLVEIESTYLEILNLFYTIIPTPGMIVRSDEANQRTLSLLQETHSTLRLYTTKLISTKNELPFWGVSLSKKAALEHDTLINTLYGHLNAAYYLQNSLTNIFTHKKEDNSLQSWQSRLNTYSEVLDQSFRTRKSITAKAMFEF